jgi:predicted 2-oxoglutarate/Fe(II)-dependent dioxygenase YbiX
VTTGSDQQSPAPRGQSPQQPNFVRIYRDTFSRDYCEEIIARFEADPRLEPSSTAIRKKPRIRTGTMLQISRHPEWSDVVQRYYEALERNLAQYAQSFFVLKQLLESPATKRTPPLMERIEPGQGFGLHVDASVSGTHDRMVAVLMYLRDIDEGGYTEFPFQSLRVKPRAGMMVLFPPYWTHPHQGVSPVNAVKYNVTGYVVIDPTWRPPE